MTARSKKRQDRNRKLKAEKMKAKKELLRLKKANVAGDELMEICGPDQVTLVDKKVNFLLI